MNTGNGICLGRAVAGLCAEQQMVAAVGEHLADGHQRVQIERGVAKFDVSNKAGAK